MAQNVESANGADDDCNGCVDDGISLLTLQKSVSPGAARRGGALTYTITANNAGPTFASVTLRDQLPPSLLFTSVSGPAGWTCTSAGEIRCTNPNFALNSPAVFTINATVAPSATVGSTITNTAVLDDAFSAAPNKTASVNAIVLANQVPVANAGPNQSHAAGSTCSIEVTLDGSASTDAEDDPLTYRWTRPGFPDLTGISPTVMLGPGSHTFTLLVSDNQGGTSLPSVVTILVTDTIPPTITAPAAVVLQADPGSCSASAAGQLGTPTGSDECGPVTFSRVPASDVFAVGTTTVVWTATDSGGNTATATQGVTVNDTTPPSITAPPAIAMTTAPNAISCAVVITDGDLGSASASDSCGTPTVARSGVPAGNSFPVGQTTITYTATDASGNTTTATQLITVTDATPPSLTAPASLALSTGAGASACALTVADSVLGVATVSDNCAGVSVNRSGVPTGNVFPVGTTTITYTATDASGNSVTATQTVTIADTTPPQITAPAALVLQSVAGTCSATATGGPGTPTVSDACGPVTVTRAPASDVFAVGTTTIVWTATDASGNTASATQTVTVRDATLPAISAPPAVTVATLPGASSCSVLISDAQLGSSQASDDCGAVSVTRAGVPAGNLFPVGQTTITYTATDTAGNAAVATQVVTVKDATPPIVTAPSSLSLSTGPNASSCALTILDAELGSASVSDNCPGVTVTRSGVPAGNVFPVGTTTIRYTATDASGNEATAIQSVTIADTTAPALTLLGAETMTLSCRATFSDPGATAIDNCDGDRTAAIVVSGIVNDTTPGTYVRTYSVTDSRGNTTTRQRTVIVQDDAPPIIQSASVSPKELWPPNHKMIPVTVTVSASDICSGANTSCRIVSVSSNEPVNGNGDGDTAPDWQIASPTLVLLRAERAGTRNDRIYTITVRCTDGAGQATDTSVTVKVPHNR